MNGTYTSPLVLNPRNQCSRRHANKARVGSLKGALIVGVKPNNKLSSSGGVNLNGFSLLKSTESHADMI